MGRDGVLRRYYWHKDRERHSCHLLGVAWSASDYTEGFPHLFLPLFALGVLLHPVWKCMHPTAWKALNQSWVPAPEI